MNFGSNYLALLKVHMEKLLCKKAKNNIQEE